MNSATRVLVALIVGLALGMGIAVSDNATLTGVARAIEPFGTVFINAIRMTIIPLVVSSLIVGITSAPDARTIGRLGGRALMFMVVSLAIACTLGVLVAGPAFSLMTIDPVASTSLRASVASTSTILESSKAIPSFGKWLVDLVPSNPIKAAADGAMLPLIIFSIAFGIALSRIDTERQRPVVKFCEGMLSASTILVQWVLRFAPLGVFALAVPLAARLGVQAAGVLATYIGVVSLLSTALILLLYPVAVIGGRVSLPTFARAAFPAQAMAFSGRSSLAALPAMITATRDVLKLPPQIAGFLVPLLTSTYRIGAGVGQTVPIVFISHLYGIELGPAQLLTVAATAIVVSFSVPGIPGGTIIAMVPVLMAAGLPVEGAGIMLGVDTIPDMFRTTSNVTGHMTAAVVLGAREESETLQSTR